MINLITNVGVAHQTNEPEWGEKEADLALVTRSLFWLLYAICEALGESRNRWRACSQPRGSWASQLKRLLFKTEQTTGGEKKHNWVLDRL